MGWRPATLGWTAATGALPSALSLPALAGLSPLVAALSVYLGGIAGLAAAVYLGTAAAARMAARRAA